MNSCDVGLVRRASQQRRLPRRGRVHASPDESLLHAPCMVLRFEEAGRIRFGHSGVLPPRRVSSTVTAPRLRPSFYTLLDGCPPSHVPLGLSCLRNLPTLLGSSCLAVPRRVRVGVALPFGTSCLELPRRVAYE